jgi:hypothetical protein
LRAAANFHIENFQEPLHRLSPTGENITYTAQSAELWITDGRSLTPAAEVLEHAFQWWRKFINEMSMP